MIQQHLVQRGNRATRHRAIAALAQALDIPRAALGLAPVFQMAAGMARRLQDALRGGSYPAPVGRELQQVAAVTMEQTGWLAHDAGWEQQARQWWLETCHIADVPEARIRALASMALQAGQRPGGGSEAVEPAQAATVIAKDSGTPRWPGNEGATTVGCAA